MKPAFYQLTMKLKRPKLPTKALLEKKLDKVFSRYIRLRDSDSLGYINCITCNKTLTYETAQNCHFISRKHRATRWDEFNCHAGCVGCNVFAGGRLDEYAFQIVDRYGSAVLATLIEAKHSNTQIKRPQLMDMIEVYEKKIEALQKKQGYI